MQLEVSRHAPTVMTLQVQVNTQTHRKKLGFNIILCFFNCIEYKTRDTVRQYLPLGDLVANQVHCFFCSISDVECVLFIVKGMCRQDVCGSCKYREVDP